MTTQANVELQERDQRALKLRKDISDSQKQAYQSLGIQRSAPGDVALFVKSHVEKWATLQLPAPTPSQIDAYAQQKTADFLALLKESPPTELEDLTNYCNILLVARILEASIKKVTPPIVFNRPIFYTIPGGGANARTLPGGDEYIVQFSAGLFALAELMARSIARTLPDQGIRTGILPAAPNKPMVVFSIDANEVQEALRTDPTGARWFTQALLSYVRHGRPDASKMPELAPAQELQASSLYQNYLEFVVAHEYGHIISKHLEAMVKDTLPGEHGSRPIKWDWLKEMEADVAGCKLMFADAAQRARNLPIVLMGIEFFLNCQEMVDRALSVMCEGDEGYQIIVKSHPPTEARRKFIYNHLISHSQDFLVGPDADGQMKVALKKSAELRQVVNLLWDLARPYCWQLYELGKDAAPIFKRESDSKQLADPTKLGSARAQIKASLPQIYEAIEKAEAVIVAGRRLIRASAPAVFKMESAAGMSQAEMENAQHEISEALKVVGHNLGGAVELFRQWQPGFINAERTSLDLYRQVIDRIGVAGAKIEGAGLSKVTATELREGTKLMTEASQALLVMGERSGVGVYLAQMSKLLVIASEDLRRDREKGCWRGAKIAGTFSVLSGESLMQVIIERWRILILPKMGSALQAIAGALRQNQPLPLPLLREGLSLEREARYAQQYSLQRSAMLLENAESLNPEEGLKFKQSANALKLQARAITEIIAWVGQAHSGLELRELRDGGLVGLAEAGEFLGAVAKPLDEAWAREQKLGVFSALGQIARVLFLAKNQMTQNHPAEAARLIEELAEKLRLTH